MNIETPTQQVKLPDNQQKNQVSSNNSNHIDEGKTFRDELVSVQPKDNAELPKVNSEEQAVKTENNLLQNKLLVNESDENKFPQQNINQQDVVKNQHNVIKKADLEQVLKAKIVSTAKDDLLQKEVIENPIEKNQTVLVQKQNDLSNDKLQKDHNLQLNKHKTLDKNKKSETAVPILNTQNEIIPPIQELQTQIESIKNLKSNSSEKAAKGTKIDTDTSIDYQSVKITMNDALFFANLVKGDQVSVNIQGQITGSAAEIKNESTQETTQVSNVLMNTITEAAKTNKPFRIDFDNDVAVIMRIDKQGKLSAEFIPGDKAVETYLKNNISLLQASFDEQKLPYNELTYRKHKQEQQNEGNNQRNKENDDE